MSRRRTIAVMMRGPGALVCLLALAWSPACAHRRVPDSPPADHAVPCRGASIPLEAVGAQCTTDGTDMPAPPEGALEMRFASDSVTVASGESVTLRAELHNVTGEPLEVYLSPLAGYLTAIKDGGQRVDERWEEERMGGIAGGVRPWKVVLEPDGVIMADVPVSARVTTLGYEPLEGGGGGYRIVTGDGGPIPPGDYTLQVYPPLSGDHDVSFVSGWGSRPMVELPLRITP